MKNGSSSQGLTGQTKFILALGINLLAAGACIAVFGVDSLSVWLSALLLPILPAWIQRTRPNERAAVTVPAAGKNRQEDGRLTERIGLPMQALFEHNPNAVCVFSSERRMLRANPSAQRVTGYSEGELTALDFSVLTERETIETLHAFFQTMPGGEPQTFEMVLVHKEGYKLDMVATAVPAAAESGESGAVIIFQDQTERKRGEERARHLAFYDDKTGLPNRRLFQERLNGVIRDCRLHGGHVAVFYLDIDRFKLVNDSFGHDHGDMLLMLLAERFARGVAENDFLARTEGDEFALCFTDISSVQTELAERAERIFHLLKQPFTVGEYQLHISASVGISFYSNSEAGDTDAETLMKHADIALSRAKEKGKSNYQIYNSDMKLISLHKLTMETDLRKALENREFELFYQPQYDIGGGEMVGMEALIRWNHPEKGRISPKDFIPVAEDSGLIVPIGEWVITEACRQNKLWQDRGFPRVPVSVNLSTRQFLQYNLKDNIARILRQTGLEPRYLELEITESMTMDVEHASRCLHELKELGVKISIDDFGTGYSSLNYLRNFPIDKLKIDQTFVRDIMTDPNDATIVSTIIAMTHHLRLRVIAEGVETAEQLHFLHRNQCHEVQGYWFSPPVPVTGLEAMLQTRLEAAPSTDNRLH